MKDNQSSPEKKTALLKKENRYEREEQIGRNSSVADKTNSNDKKSPSPYLKAISYGIILVAAIATASHLFTPQEKQISQEQKQQVKENFDAAIAAGVTIPIIDKQESIALIQAMNINQDKKDHLKKAIQQEQQQFMKVILWDTMDEDGDIVSVNNGAGISQEVNLVNAPQTLNIPIPTSSDGITITGAKDGVGGITVGIQTENKAALPLPYLTPGESVFIPK